MTQIILSSIAIGLSVIFTLYLLVKKGRSFASSVLAVMLLAMASLEFFDLFALLQPERLLLWKKCAVMTESVLPLLWMLYSLTFARLNEPRSLSLLQKGLFLVSCLVPITAIYFPVGDLFYSPDFAIEHVLFLGTSAYYFYLVLLLYTIVPLINLETTLANSTHGYRWKIKFEILGAMSLLAVMLVYYSQGLLYRTINMDLLPLRSLVLLAAVGLIAYSRLFRGNGVKIYVSKQMAFRSVVLLGVGIYLVGLGLLGEGMKYFGESFQRSLVVAAAFLAGVGLLVVFLSETVKRKIKGFLHTNFYQNKYDYRVQWLHFTERLASAKSGNDLLRTIVSEFTDVFGMGCGALYLYDPDKSLYVNAACLEIDRNDVMFDCHDQFIEFVREEESIVVLSEGTPEPVSGSTDFLKENRMAFLVPLRQDNSLEGFVLLGRPVDKQEIYTEEDHDLMMTLASQALSAILNLRLSEELGKAREMEAVGRLSAFMLHDLKNLASSLSLVVDNARQFIDSPEFQADMLETLEGTVTKMKKLVLRLKKLEEKTELQRGPTDLLELSLGTAAMTMSGEVQVSGEATVAEVDREEMEKVLLNLIINSLDATGGNGPVKVDVNDGEGCSITVADQGCGMTDEFMKEHLFKPFRTTKAKGLGIGLYQCRQIVEAHGGRIEVESEVGSGTVFTVKLPKAPEGAVKS